MACVLLRKVGSGASGAIPRSPTPKPLRRPGASPLRGVFPPSLHLGALAWYPRAMSEPLTVVFGVAAVILLLYAVLSARQHQDEVRRLRGEIDDLESQNRRLLDDQHRLGNELRTAQQVLERLEADKAALEAKRDELEATLSRLEKARADLETSLAALRGQHDALKGRVVDFQGEWSKQLTTLEEEIGTLNRQIGEFRKGTRLPIPPGE